jgi:hypothetical protein
MEKIDVLKSYVDDILAAFNPKDWPDTCEICKKKITETIFLRLNISFDETADNDEITMHKESYCKKCIESVQTGMIVEVPLD